MDVFKDPVVVEQVRAVASLQSSFEELEIKAFYEEQGNLFKLILLCLSFLILSCSQMTEPQK